MATHFSNNPSPNGGEPLSVPLLDVQRSNGPISDEILSAISRVYESGRFIGGPDCQQLEESVAKLCDTEYAVGCASGSDALLLALMACGIGEGDEVIVPSFTFFATASAVWRLGANPVFADIDPTTFNLDPASVEQEITEATKAVIPVHLFGQCADMDALNDIAIQNDLWVIEDAAQAIGATYKGQPAGSLGDIACFSFYPTKNLGGIGDGGMLTTSEEEVYEELRLLAAHGMRPRYYHSIVGVNSRLDSLQAAALNVKLQHLESWSEDRRENALRYEQLFADTGVVGEIELPANAEDCGHVWNQYTIRVTGGRRDWLREQLSARNIGTEVYYPVPLHMQECFHGLCPEGSLPETERAAREVLSLPIFPGLTEEEQHVVVQTVSDLLSESGEHRRAA